MRHHIDRSVTWMTFASAILGVGLAAFAPAGASAQGPSAFATGELYLLNSNLPDVGAGILRVSPLTGETALLTDIPEIPAVRATLTYDSFRDRLVYVDTRNSGGIVAVDAAGNRSDLAPPEVSPRVVAARGDGLLYLCGLAGGAFRYLDGSDAPHDLLDEPGTGAFHFAAGNSLEEMIYDPHTNSLLCFTGQRNGAVCSTANRTCAIKIPLAADGRRVAGPVEFTEVNLSPGFPSFPLVASGSGLTPAGDVFYVMDTNNNDLDPRMQVLDVATMTSSTFASNGSYVGASATHAGTFSTLRGQAVILDGNPDSLRAYGQGEAGRGTPLAGGISDPSSGLARLVEIRASPATEVGARDPQRGDSDRFSIWPNPASATVTLRYELPAGGSARVSIYDTAGRLVRILGAGRQSAGRNSLPWDALDDRGVRVTPGVYLAVLETTEGRRSRKFAVVR